MQRLYVLKVSIISSWVKSKNVSNDFYLKMEIITQRR